MGMELMTYPTFFLQSIEIKEIYTELIGNLLFGIFTVIGIFLLAFIVILRTRAKRLRVLGVDKRISLSNFPIYIAHLVIVKGGALLADGTPSLHFEGRAVPIREVESAQKICDHLRSGLIESLPNKILNQLTNVSAAFSPVNVSINPAPLDVNKIKNLTRAIIIGGPEFNTATEYFLEKADMFRILDPKDCVNPTISIKNRDGKDELILPDDPDYNLGIVERATFEDGKQIVLILTGVGSNGTLAAVDWFLKNWDRLNSVVGNKDFGVCLQCPRRKIDPQGYLQWTLRREYPEGVITGNISF
jgi:hypothetical protein